MIHEMVPGTVASDVATARYQLASDLTCKYCTVQMFAGESGAFAKALSNAVGHPELTLLPYASLDG